MQGSDSLLDGMRVLYTAQALDGDEVLPHDAQQGI
jgi:hypothetical protein